eukprot:GFUD01025675.1.p1 GENE.GFUD01025675.1~~GFUD01025675.1.p1  ORF type:complete len:440 (+),score=100.43 GFUD01025675.1:24-1322(+)
MALIGTQLMSKVFGQSKAEKAFRTWWDTVEDYMIYSLVALGLAVMPTAMVTSSQLECTLCKNETAYCGENPDSRYDEDPIFNPWWVKQACTFNGSVGSFMLHFPYILLMIALVLFAIERVFTVVFKEGAKHETLYTVLVHRKVIREESTADVVDGRDIAEIKQSFLKSKGYYISYLIRTVLELLIGSGLAIFLIVRGLPMVATKKDIICDLHGFLYECAGHPQELYFILLYIVIVITIGFILCNLYNLVWMFVPSCGKFSRFMSRYKNCMKCAGMGEDNLASLNRVYYHNYDLHLLLNLLANSSGIAPAVAAIAQFDESFYNALKPEFVGADTFVDDGGELRLEFRAPASTESRALTSAGAQIDIYTEIIAFNNQIEDENQISEVIADSSETMSKTFAGLNEGEEFLARVSTVMDGTVVSSVSKIVSKIVRK